MKCFHGILLTASSLIYFLGYQCGNHHFSSEEIKSYNYMRLGGGARAGSPMAVTYADERPPSTVKSVPLGKHCITIQSKKGKEQLTVT